ncbi:MFS transporter [Embleya sp. AB8]|uniref:MFS transporter n=1 Tax=Embleya sp. AB8 TaxID=3156304 RepID=UPI003C73CB4D
MSTTTTPTSTTAVPPTRRRLPGRRNPHAALAVLTACVFVVGTAEYVMTGLVPELAADLDRPVSTTGSLVGWYALTVTIAGPLVTVALLRLPQRRVLIGLLVAFTAGNAAAALATGYDALLAARVGTALTHSTTFAVALVAAVGAAPVGQRGRAVAAVASGWNLASVLGAPLGTWIGDRYGWRTTFWAIAACGLLVAVAAAVLVRPPRPPAPPAPRAEVRALLRPRVGLILAATVLAQAGLFTAYTFIGPLLRGPAGFGAAGVSVLLAVFGAGALLGNALGGRFADRGPARALCAAILALAATLALFAGAIHTQPTTVGAMFVLGAASAVLIPLLQERALDAAPGAPTLVTAVSASAFNLGIASGASIGGRSLDSGLELSDLAWLGALVTLAALLPALAAAARSRYPQHTPQHTSHDTPITHPGNGVRP